MGFAYLGSVYMRDVLRRPSPTVGLLNVGEEEEKGNAITREAHGLLKRSPRLHYIGNIEGRDIVAGHHKFGMVDVVVCDGFVGNVVLKFYESVARLFVGLVKQQRARHARAARDEGAVPHPRLLRVRRRAAARA